MLAVLITLFTSIQTLYLEGMRLRTRDLPSLQYFKSELEPRLNLRSEEGALTFSLWKHSCLVLFGVAGAGAGDRRRNADVPGDCSRALIGAWLLMMLCAYLVPQLLFRRTSGHWICAPACRFTAARR